jgi:predicted metal-dependent phosphoesterase TrpH
MTYVVLAPDSAIDLQLHTVHSDGKWLPELLIDHLKKEQFGLAAITDHDRVDIIVSLQNLASEKQMPLLVATEMTTVWEGGITDILCYGFDPANNELGDLAQDILRRQQENTREVYENLRRRGYINEEKHADDLAAILEMPCARQPHALVEMIERQGYNEPLNEIFQGSGLALQTNDTAAVVDAAHRSGAVCIISHPGRSDGFCRFDEQQFDQLRKDVPFDGLEVYYPVHTPAQIAMFQEYTHKHHLLTSSGSDSHGPDKPPIKYRANLSRRLLERLGIEIKL